MVDEAEKEESQDGEKKGGGSSNMKIILLAVIVSVVLSGVMVGAALYFIGDDSSQQADAADDEEGDEDGDTADEDDIDPDAPPQYVSMDPKFVVSFSNQRKARFMQFSLQVMSRDDETINQLNEHMPAVRSSLLMLVGSQEYESVSSREGKEALLAEITADINRTLDEISGLSGIEAAYFETFMIQ